MKILFLIAIGVNIPEFRANTAKIGLNTANIAVFMRFYWICTFLHLVRICVIFIDFGDFCGSICDCFGGPYFHQIEHKSMPNRSIIDR